MKRKRRARENPTARELGALVITTAVTAGVAAMVTWWVTKKLSTGDAQPQQPPSRPLPAQPSDQGGVWA